MRPKGMRASEWLAAPRMWTASPEIFEAVPFAQRELHIVRVPDASSRAGGSQFSKPRRPSGGARLLIALRTSNGS
jgi:hypothetical protein